jgi:hypothetical protein
VGLLSINLLAMIRFMLGCAADSLLHSHAALFTPGNQRFGQDFRRAW